MPVFKNESNNTWYVMARYVNWKGERKQKCKRGFTTKREAQEWERMFQLQTAADLDMSFEEPLERKHMADQGTHHPHENPAVFRQVENQ